MSTTRSLIEGAFGCVEMELEEAGVTSVFVNIKGLSTPGMDSLGDSGHDSLVSEAYHRMPASTFAMHNGSAVDVPAASSRSGVDMFDEGNGVADVNEHSPLIPSTRRGAVN